MRVVAGLVVVLAVAAGAAPAPAQAPDTPGFTFTAHRLTAADRERMTGVTWRPGCPVGLADLRRLRIAYWDFAGERRVGALVVHRDATSAMRRAFEALYEDRFPIRRMRPIEAYAGDDYASIEADNTSAFNCRAVTGGTGWSQHAYGRALDINPIENPYVTAAGTTSHRKSRPYLNRARVRPGMAVAGGPVVRAFAAVGWGWGGTWSGIRDYQHFSATGR